MAEQAEKIFTSLGNVAQKGVDFVTGIDYAAIA